MVYKFETIKFDLWQNGIGIITLNRPDKLNAINFQMEEDLHSLLDHLMINMNCRVLILKGAGKIFCAGIDLNEALILNSEKKPENYKKFYYLDVPEPLKRKIYHQWNISQIFVKMRRVSQPIIAVIHGPAVGGGFGFALAADMCIVSKEAKFINAAISIGLTGADVGSSYFLPRLIGMSRAAEILYTGRAIDGREAVNIGLALKLMDQEDLLDAAVELAENLLAKSPLGLRMTKEAINLSLDAPSLETIIQLENNSIVLTFSSKDGVEGLKSFLEKRKPKYPLL